MHATAAPMAAVLAVCAVLTGHPAPAAAQSWTVTVINASAGRAVGGGPPGAPTSPSATCHGTTSSAVDISWNAAMHATRYTVSDSSSQNGTYATVTTTAITSATVTGLATGTYYFKISATIGDNWSGPQSAATTARTILSNALVPLGSCA